MDTRESLSAKLPPTRQDEPAQLRQDILDELSDHLTSAYNREILRGVESSVAHRRVLEQFGNPAALARRLWLEAMKGKIMTQRVVIGTCVLVTAVSLGLVGLIWQQSQRMVTLQLAEARAREVQMRDQLRAMSEAIQHPRSPDWNPVRVKLTEETPDGPPVAGAAIVLIRSFENPPKTIRKVSDTAGLADFGSINPGDYTLQINMGSENWSLQHSGSLNVQPGTDVTQSIICPKIPPLRAGVRVRCKWPADLEKEALCLYAAFSLGGRQIGPGNRWAIQRLVTRQPASYQNQMGTGAFFSTQQRAVLCGPGSKISEFVELGGPYVWTFGPDSIAKNEEDAAEYRSREWADVVVKETRELKDSSATIDVEAGNYGLSEVLVLRPMQPQSRESLDPSQKRYELLVIASAFNSTRAVNRLVQPPKIEHLHRIGGNWISNPTESRFKIQLPPNYWRQLETAFEARSGQPNEWTIPIPDELAQAVREALIKADKSLKASPEAKTGADTGNG
jgi:hypothetical protein